GEDPHLQLPAEPRHRPPHRPLRAPARRRHAGAARAAPRSARRPLPGAADGERVGRRLSAVTVSELLAEGRARLAGLPFAAPREATLLLAPLLGRGEASLLAHGDEPVRAAEAARFRALVARRCAGEPVAYLTGRREFWGRDFAVDARV